MNIFHIVYELWPGHGLLYGIKSRGNNSKTKNARVVFLRSYGPDTVYYMQLRQGKIIQKQKMQELSSLFMTHRINVMHALVKFHEYIPYSSGVMAPIRFTIWN